MTTSDALIVGEGWISEHYFTTDSTSQSFTAKVIERRKLWDAESAADRPTTRSRFLAARQELEVAFGGLGELIAPEADRGNGSVVQDRAAAIHDRVLQILELAGHGLSWDRVGALLRVSQAGMTDRAPLAVILGAPCAELEDVLAKVPAVDDSEEPVAAATLFEPVRLDEDGPELTSAARLTSALFVSDDHPELGRRSLPGRGSATGVRAQRHQARRRDRPGPDLLGGRIDRSRR